MLKRTLPLLFTAIATVAGCGSAVVPPAPPAGSVPRAALPVEDENDPLKHVKKLQDPATSALAVRNLVQFFDDALTKDNKDRNGPNVKSVLDKIVDPLSKSCVTGSLDEKTHATVVRFLAYARDARGASCLEKTIADYEHDGTDEDVRLALRAVAAMKTQSAAGPVFDAFTKLRHSKPKDSLITRDLHDALLELVDPSWENPCVTMIGKPINDRRDLNILKDEFYWEITCSEILGALKSESAIKPLIKIVLSPVKADAQMTAIYSLIKIGKPAISPLVSLLQAADTDLIEYAKIEYLKANQGPDGKPPEAARKAAPMAYVMPAAFMLGWIGREEAMQPMLDAIAKADETNKVVISRELLKLPTTTASVDAVKRVYEKTSIPLTIPPGLGAREALMESMAHLFDASLVPWMVKTALDVKGDDADIEIEEERATTLITIMKLVKADQIAMLNKLAFSKIADPDGKPVALGKGYEKELKSVRGLLAECGDKIDCYYAKLEDPKSHVGDNQFIGIKSAYMVGVLGGADVRTKLIELLPKITNAATNYIAVQVIDRFSPQGDATLAAKLQKMVDEAEASKKGDRIATVAPFKPVIYRLRGRLR